MNAVRDTVPLQVDLQIATDAFDVPDGADWTAWVGAALSAGGRDASGIITVRLVNAAESAGLNGTYRNRQGPTNVLAFSGPDEVIGDAAADMMSGPELGDLVICLPVAVREAGEQGKLFVAHLAHLVVHGTLHLIGYDHQHETDAQSMESLEIRVLAGLGFANPYEVDERKQ